MEALYDLDLSALGIDAGALRGKVVLVVNTASKCGLTPQLAGLESMHQSREKDGLVVLGLPSPDFMNQEFSDDHEIRAFYSQRYGVSFPLATVSHVKGEETNSLYAWLLAQGGVEPEWNFQKYLVGRDGHLICNFRPNVKPDDAALLDAVSKALEAPSC